MENKRKKKTVRFVPLTRKEPLSQRIVFELFSGSESTQLVKDSTPGRVEVETSAKKLPSAWTFVLLKEKPLKNQEATVSAALSIIPSLWFGANPDGKEKEYASSHQPFSKMLLMHTIFP